MTIGEIMSGGRLEVECRADIPSRSEKYMRTVVAFANANGGRLVFGAEKDTGRGAGFTKTEAVEKMEAITDAIYESCEPKIIPNAGIQEADGKYIIIIDVPAGMQRPYCIRGQRIIEGVYLRLAGATRKAAIYQIQEMALSARNRSFDSEKAERELSGDEMDRFCDRIYRHAKELRANEEAGDALKRLGIRQLLLFKAVVEEKGKFYATNGYQLLDGRLGEYPDAVIQCTVFRGTTRSVSVTRKEFAGCIDEEIESACAFVLEHLEPGARIGDPTGQDTYELPVYTIRQLIAEAVCHRSYLCPGRVQVALFDDRLEVTSPGMLDKDLTIEKMKAGNLKIRNGVIAKVFAYMNLVEGWGSGILKMFQEANDYGLQEPELQELGSDFRINLYRKG